MSRVGEISSGLGCSKPVPEGQRDILLPVQSSRGEAKLALDAKTKTLARQEGEKKRRLTTTRP